MTKVAILLAVGIGLGSCSDGREPPREQVVEEPQDSRSLEELSNAHGTGAAMVRRIAFDATQNEDAAAGSVAELAVRLTGEYANAQVQYYSALRAADLARADALEGQMRARGAQLGRLAAAATLAAKKKPGLDAKLWSALATEVSRRWIDQLARTPELPADVDVLRKAIEGSLEPPDTRRGPDYDLVDLVATAFDVQTYPSGVALAYRGDTEPARAKAYADYMRDYNRFLNAVERSFGATLGSLR